MLSLQKGTFFEYWEAEFADLDVAISAPSVLDID